MKSPSDADAEGRRLPIKIDATSNGEFEPGAAGAGEPRRQSIGAGNGCGISAEEVRKQTRADAIARERYAYRERPQPHYRTYGPKTRREFLNLLRWNGGSRA